MTLKLLKKNSKFHNHNVTYKFNNFLDCIFYNKNYSEAFFFFNRCKFFLLVFAFLYISTGAQKNTVFKEESEICLLLTVS